MGPNYANLFVGYVEEQIFIQFDTPKPELFGRYISPVYMAQTNPGRTRVRPGLKLTQVVFTRHFSKLTRVEPGLVVFTRQTNPGRTWVSSVYTTETNPGRTLFSLYRVNRAIDDCLGATSRAPKKNWNDLSVLSTLSIRPSNSNGKSLKPQ